MIKQISVLTLCALVIGVFLIAIKYPQQAIGNSLGTIEQLNQFTSTTSPFDAITTNENGKDLYIPFSDATTSSFAITGLDCTGNANGGTLTTDANGNVACSDDDSGSGGSTFAWTPETAGNATSTTILFKNGFISSASSTFTGLATFSDISATSTLDYWFNNSGGITGNSNITTLGTIGTGVWNGTTIGEIYGGTNQTTYTAGDILYASGANTLSKLGVGTNNQVLVSNGTSPVYTSDLVVNSIETATFYVSDTVKTGDLKVSPGNILTGQTATTTISGNNATSTFAGGISLTSGNINIPTGGVYEINDTLVLSSSGLGTGILSSSLTSLGTITTGVWNGTAVDISSYTNLTAGTNITLSGDTLNVDDAFLVNNADDTTTGQLTANKYLSSNNGTIALPAYSFTGDTSTGLYAGSSLLGVSIAGSGVAIFDADGLGIGRAPFFTFEVETTDTSVMARMRNKDTSTGDGMQIRIDAATPGTGNDFLTFVKASGGIIGSVDGNGSGGVNFNTTSDIRTKRNIEYLSDILPRITKLNPFIYTGIGATTTSVGFSAQEVGKVFPRTNITGYDEEQDLYSMDYSKISALLVQAVKEVVYKITGINKRLDKLEKENEELRARLDKLEND